MIEQSYETNQGEFGSTVIRQFGRCDNSEATVRSILAGQSNGYLVALPHARGVVWKPLDGTNPIVRDIRPTTIPRTFKCVKVAATVNPFAATQSGGVFNGKAVLRYEIIWQQVGALD
jgi:hypothetical protein